MNSNNNFTVITISLIILTFGIFYFIIITQTPIIEKEEFVTPEEEESLNKTDIIIKVFPNIVSPKFIECYLGLNDIMGTFYLTNERKNAYVLTLEKIKDDCDYNETLKKINKNKYKNEKISNCIDDLENMLPKKRDLKATYKKKKFILMTKTDKFFNIKNTSRFGEIKKSYDVTALNSSLFESILKIKRLKINDKEFNYVKFPNDYYMTIDKNGHLNATKTKSRILFCSFIQQK